MPFDYDADSGDIALATSTSSPQLSTILTGASASSSARQANLNSPTPKRLHAKPLWRPQPSGAGASHDEEEGEIPLAGPSSYGSKEGDTPIRPSSANHHSTKPREDEFLTPTQRAPHPTRRTSSNTTLTRSRSLNLRLPSKEVDFQPSSPAKQSPMSSTTRTPSMRIGYSRKPGEPRPPPLLNPEVNERMGRWVKEIVVCNFDLEKGPVVERRAGGRRWGPGEKENVAFSSFPDTSLFSEGSILFSFKIRHIPPDPTTLAYPEPPSPMPGMTKSFEQSVSALSVPGQPAIPHSAGGGGIPKSTSLRDMSKGEKAEEYRKWDERGREWLYGFVWFEQRRDKGIARGYMQKSLVILTHLPFPALFSALLHRIAPAFFQHGYPALEAVCHSIASWPDPRPDALIELPFMTDILTVKLPDATESPQVGRAFGPASSDHPILASLPHSTPLRAFATILPSLWSLWECLILAEPVLVIAPDPRTCSDIVWWLRDLLRPIPPAGDFRPYLHIHDHDFSLLVNSNKPQAGVVVGVTNPFFRNAASHWPNVISITADRPSRVATNGNVPASSMKVDQPEGFISRRHRSVQKDRVLLKRLESLVAEGKLDDPGGNEALRAHFQQLTEKMLVPLNRYFQTLVPNLSPSPSPIPISSNQNRSHIPKNHITTLKPFSLPSFLTHLRTHGPNPLAFKTKGLSTESRVETDFYAAFCTSAGFAGWLGARVDSLGLAVAAQTSSLAVPATTMSTANPASVGLGLSNHNGGNRAVSESDSQSQSGRFSSGDESSVSAGVRRESEESRSSLGVGSFGSSYFGARRESRG